MRILKLVAMTLAISIAAAGTSLAQEKKTYKIGAAVYGLKGEFMQMWAKALSAHPLVKDGTVVQLNNEAPGQFAVSDADTLLAQAKAQA